MNDTHSIFAYVDAIPTKGEWIELAVMRDTLLNLLKLGDM